MPVQTKNKPRNSPLKSITAQRDKWLRQVDALFHQAQLWASDQDWSVATQTKMIDEPPLASYEMPLLRIRTPQGEVRFDPVGSLITGAQGRVNLEAWPSLNRVRLVWRDGAMQIITDSNVPLRSPWNRKTFVQLVNDLLAP